MLIDYHVHALAHGEYKADHAWLSSFVDQACRMGIIEMGFSEHDEFMAGLDLNIFQQVKKERQQEIDLRLGIEIDYFPGMEKEIAEKLSQANFDYAIGSVHYIDGWAFDHPDYKQGFDDRDIDEIYFRYAQILAQMVSSKMFDIVGHIDLVKIWGHRPQRQIDMDYFFPVLKEIKRTGMVVEINSAGLRKPVGELYPSGNLLAKLYDMNIPITLGSDAHHPQQMGVGLEDAWTAARKAGYRTVTGFNKHRPIRIPV
jgi:histidinol-phosphatase (PHP family)